MKKKATKRKKKKNMGSTHWESRINDKVLLSVSTPQMHSKVSSANLYKIRVAHGSSLTQFLPLIHELSDVQGKPKGQKSLS
jgi:hypothetical protein